MGFRQLRGMESRKQERYECWDGSNAITIWRCYWYRTWGVGMWQRREQLTLGFERGWEQVTRFSSPDPEILS